MSSATEFVLEIKNSKQQHVPLYPSTSLSQVVQWEGQEVFGPFVFELNSANWNNNQQIFDLPEVLNTDIVKCVRILEGSKEDMQNQLKAYNLLDPLKGVESLNGEIRFTATKTPEHSVKVQVFWTR